MQIIIEIKNKITKLLLQKNKKTIDEIVFLPEQNISRHLLPFFDEILKRNNLTVEDIKKIEVETDLGDSYTSRRIAEAVKNAFDWTQKRKNGKMKSAE